MTTCIPNCAQIVNNLGFIELSENQPDLVVCVYHVHLKQLLADIRNHYILCLPLFI